MDLNDLFLKAGIDAKQVLIFRHRPRERQLNKVLPWLAAERPKLFNAYQQTQGAIVEKAMSKARYVASFIRHEPGKALFVGLYTIGASKPLTRKEYWRVPAYIELKKFGMEGPKKKDHRPRILWFELALKEDFYASWKGKLIVKWPGNERSWWRRAHRNKMEVLAVLEDNALVAGMPNWDEMVWTWQDLGVMPARWKSRLSEWRGIYFIFDESDGKGYVGSASGEDNLYQRWTNYAVTGHGGNVLLKKRTPEDFRFSILERVSPDMGKTEIIHLENKWKKRLHTVSPNGLN
jgi:hypothetical protein